MPRKGNIIPKAPIGRIMKECGAKRISNEALEVFSSTLESYADKIASQAARIAKHSGRKTVLDTDVKLALK